MYMSNDKATVGRRMVYTGVAKIGGFLSKAKMLRLPWTAQEIAPIIVSILSISCLISGFVLFVSDMTNRAEARAKFEVYFVEKQKDANYIVKVKNINPATREYHPEDDRSFTFLVYKDSDYEETICLDSLEVGRELIYIARKAAIEAERQQLLLKYEHE